MLLRERGGYARVCRGRDWRVGGEVDAGTLKDLTKQGKTAYAVKAVVGSSRGGVGLTR